MSGIATIVVIVVSVAVSAIIVPVVLCWIFDKLGWRR